MIKFMATKVLVIFSANKGDKMNVDIVTCLGEQQ
jgi:hypothetical protein